VFQRKLLEELRKWVGTRNIIVVTGMRQVGKTTLMKILYSEIPGKNKVFLDLENPINRKVFEEEDYDNIWANLAAFSVTKKEKAFVFLDELQRAPGIVPALKYLFDNYDVQFFVTGSSSFYLKDLFPESLAGRKVLLEMFPLDFDEFLLFKGFPRECNSIAEKSQAKNNVVFERNTKHYSEFLEYGGFPKVVLAADKEEKYAALDDIFTSYFEKDVRTLADFADLAKLRDFILLLMQRSGSKLNVARLASELSVARPTVYSYLSFLEATYFISLVTQFSLNRDREVRSARKVYLCDTGILNRFARVSSGVILENAVFNVLRSFGEVNYYETRSGSETDFIVGKATALEVKETGTEHDLRKTRAIAEKLALTDSFVVSKNFVQAPGFICASDL